MEKFYNYCLSNYSIKQLFEKWCVKLYGNNHTYNLHNLTIFLNEYVDLIEDKHGDISIVNKYDAFDFITYFCIK